MSGFMSSTTALKIFEAPAKNPDADRLREHGFSPTPGPDGKRVGWVGLGNPLDLAFDFGIDHGRFLAFSCESTNASPPARRSKSVWLKLSGMKLLPMAARFPPNGKRN